MSRLDPEREQPAGINADRVVATGYGSHKITSSYRTDAAQNANCHPRYDRCDHSTSDSEKPAEPPFAARERETPHIMSGAQPPEYSGGAGRVAAGRVAGTGVDPPVSEDVQHR